VGLVKACIFEHRAQIGYVVHRPERKRARAKVDLQSKVTKAIKVAKIPKSAKQSGPKSEARAGSKKEIVLKLLRREGGATLAEIAKATEWQNQASETLSVRRSGRRWD
jgi:hypothetical protein